MASDDNNIRGVNLSDLNKIVGGSDDIEEMLKNLGDSSGSTRYYENPSTPVTCSKCSSSNLSFQGIENSHFEKQLPSATFHTLLLTLTLRTRKSSLRRLKIV